MFEFQSATELNSTGSINGTAILNSSAKANDERAARIRVLRIAHASLTPALRGRERALARCFPEIDMQVVTPPRWHETGVEVETVPDDLFPVITAGTFLSKHIQLFVYNPLPIIKALRRHKPHIIDMDHEPYSIPCAEIITLRNWFSPASRIVMQTAQNILKNYPPPFSMLETRALKQVSAAYMCSETVREVLETKSFGKPTVLAPFGVDLDLFYPRKRENREEEILTIGYVGRLLPAKGLLTLIDALAEIKSENWRLLVVGAGAERPAMERKLAGSGLLERAEFAGAVPYEKTPEYFQRLDVLVVPTQTTAKIREQFGRVIIEAMACEVPVIGSTCGAIPEVIGDAGLIFPETDASVLAEKLRLILSDGDLRKKLARAGRRRVEENFTWECAAKQIFSAYETVLEIDRQKG